MRKCLACGQEWGDDIPFCGACGNATVEVAAAPVEETPVVGTAPVQKMQPKKWMLILAAVVAALAVVGGLGLLTNWFGLVSPLHGLGKAMKKTLTADSLTMKVSYRRINPDGEDWREKSTIKVSLNEEKKKVTYMTESDGYVRVYDGGDVYYYEEPEDRDDRGYAYYFEGDGNDKAFFDAYNDIYDGKKVNWSEVVKEADLTEYIKKNEVDDFVKTVYKDYLKDKKWLKNNLGYSKKGNTYTFEPDIQELGESIIEMCDDSDAFKRDARRGIANTIDEYMDDADEYGVDVTVTIKVKRGYISTIHIEGETEDGYGIELDIEITDVNKTEVPVSEVKKDVEDLLEEYGCDQCGEQMGYHEDDGEYLCSDCYYVCYKCGEWGSYETSNGMLCWECYYVCAYCGDSDAYYGDGDTHYCWDHRNVCDECYERCGSTNYFNSEEWCDDCYHECYRCSDDDASYTYNGKRYCWDCYYYLYY